MASFRRLALIAAIAAAGLAASDALALTQFVILGKWCSSANRYEFSAKRLKVHRFKDGSRSNYTVLGYQWFDNTMKVIWRKDNGDQTWTRFGNFSANGQIMTQLPETDHPNMPRREYRRCKR